MTSYGPVTLWLLFGLIGAITYAIRGSFIGLFGRLEEIPPEVQTVLRYVPAAVLAGLVFPEFVALEPNSFEIDKLLAGLLAAVLAWRTEDVLATLIGGMGTLWVLRLFVL